MWLDPFTHVEKSCSGQLLLTVPYGNCRQYMNCAETDIIAGMQEAFLKFATVLSSSHRQWHNMFASLSTPHIHRDRTPLLTYNKQEQLVSAAKKVPFSRSYSLPYTMSFLCQLPTKANSVEHFAGFSLLQHRIFFWGIPITNKQSLSLQAK